jgi:hypothetical protein
MSYAPRTYLCGVGTDSSPASHERPTRHRATQWLRAGAVAVVIVAPVAARTGSQAQPADTPPRSSQTLGADEPDQKEGRNTRRGDILADAPDLSTQITQVTHALMRLPIAAGLATVLAIRPRRRGTPHRRPPVVQTQIILAIVGAVVMLVVGASLARAFGIVGAAGLVRYRARIEDPKDAGVMLSTLAIGLASGVGLWMLAVFGTVFFLAVLWIVESFEPKATQPFALKVRAKDPAAIRPAVERLLRRDGLDFELRTISKEEVCYDMHFPVEEKTDRLSQRIVDLDPENVAVQWEEKKEKK